jgi:AcrR family transcriptional regulator
MNGIAKQAGASTKTIYTRHADKGEILQAAVKRTIDRHISSHAPRWRSSLRPTIPAIS